MAIKADGSISLITDIVGEFGGTPEHSLKEYYRNGTGGVTSNNTNVPVSPNPLNMLSFYNAVKQFSHTITANQQELNLYSYLIGVGWNGSDPVALTINSGIYIWSDNTATAGLIIPSNFNNILTITNNGYIIGKGGAGGNYTTSGNAGGPALSNSATGVTFTNASGAYIAGGGGGGGGGGSSERPGGGGGAGGGAGGNGDYLGVIYGGAGGAVGQSGSAGQLGKDSIYAGQGGGTGGGGGDGTSWFGGGGSGGGGGGRILTGTGGAGGLNGQTNGPVNGGAGGSANSAGTNAAGGGGGGGWGAAGGSGGSGAYAGGAGGAAISGTTIASLTNNGTIYGAVA